jgi:hypothetical protein
MSSFLFCVKYCLSALLQPEAEEQKDEMMTTQSYLEV